MISRRSFIWESGAMAATFALPGMAAESSGLRLGVIADLHIKSEDSMGTFERTLRFFDRQRVDAVVCAGDLATSGITSELERVARTWFAVFPDGRRSDGEKVEQLFIYGDHDMGGYAWKESQGVLSDEELGRQRIDKQPDTAWKQFFREDWQAVQVKHVKGVAFVLAHHPQHNEETAYGNFIPGVEAALGDLAKRVGSAPFFYVQHRPIPGLAGDDTVWKSGDPRMAAILRKYPNCVAITGHTHRSCRDEKMLWQDDFTAINVPCLRYLCLPAGRENSSPNPHDGQQGYLADVTALGMTVKRLDFSYSTGEEVAPQWQVAFDEQGRKENTFAARLAREISPQFPTGAKVSISGEKVFFPAVLSTAKTPRAFDYELVFEGSSGQTTKRVYSIKSYLPEALDGGMVTCAIPREEIGEGKFSVTVYPCGCFGAKGRGIAANG